MRVGFGIVTKMQNNARQKNLFQAFNSTYVELGLKPIEKTHILSERSRVVHDLGIAGDDIDEILTAMKFGSVNHTQIKKLKPFIPTETSNDAYLVSMARSQLANILPCLKRFYVNRISCPPITVSNFIDILDLPDQRHNGTFE
jgi:hypothetical protein